MKACLFAKPGVRWLTAVVAPSLWLISAPVCSADEVAAATASPAPVPAPTATLPNVPLHEIIDQEIGAALLAKGITPAVKADDAEFLRRTYLDLTGSIPTLGEAKAFLDDKSPVKRQQLVDRLLNSPEYARHMQRVFDVVLMERRPAQHVPQAQWEEYLRSSFAANKSWDVLVREILAADGADANLRPAARFYLDRGGEPNLLARDVGRLFLGRDMQCAQCHDHPLVDGYLQADYYGLMAFFSRSFLFAPKSEPKAVVFAEKAEGDVAFKSVFVAGATDQPARPHLPGEKEIDEPQFEKGQEYAVTPADGVRPLPKFSRRSQLPVLLPRAENVAFRRNIANRLWALMMGRGLVHPLDMQHAANPPSHPVLLDVLGDRFAAMSFDVKAFLRELALSETYQRSSELPPGVESAMPETHAVAPLKPLSAEQLALAALQATGITDAYRAQLGPALNEATLYEKLSGNLAPFVNIFAGQAGQPEQDFQATLEQTLFMTNGGLLRSWIGPQGGNLADRLNRVNELPSVAEQLYLCVLSRPPAAEEVAELTAYLQARAQDRPAAIQEWIWALLTSDEFRFNH
ncbi:MAG TPA: DUF1549 domain-containing protein [Pirellulales bacterium]|nr:DUF1549 domain-containing protein [Pirellulales bacterium]